MGAPKRITLEDRFLRGRPPTVLIGRQIHVEDNPREGLYPNITDSHSDPNFAGAYDHEKICYDRIITVEIDTFLGISKDEYPDTYNENQETVKLQLEVYEQLHFDVPREERSDKLREEQASIQKGIHRDEVVKMNELEFGKKIYMVYGAKCEELPIEEKKGLLKLIKKAGDRVVRV